MVIRSIKTEYSGLVFESTLEADWALNLDRLTIAWDYEPEGVRLPNGANYRPDFYLPRLTTWLEVKGPHDQRIIKPHALAVACLHAPGCSRAQPSVRLEVNPRAECACGFGVTFPWRLVVVGRPNSSGKLTFHGVGHPHWPEPQIVLNECVHCGQFGFADAATRVRLCRRCHLLDERGFVTPDGAWAQGVHPARSRTFHRVPPPRGRGRSRGVRTVKSA